MKRGPILSPGGLPVDAQAKWRQLNNEFAPYRISDQYTEDLRNEIGSLNEVAWISLYALSLRVAEHLKGSRLLVQGSPPVISEPLPWTILAGQYDQRRLQLLQGFKKFLRDWGIQHVLEHGTPPTALSEQTDTGDESKVLGLHFFRAEADVQAYVRRWHENPLIKSPALRNHEFISLGAIDLICSELIENGFVHSAAGSQPRSVFIIAKLCTVDSCRMDLALHGEIGHLSKFEQRIFRHSIETKVPHLQVVIGDLGCGIDGNERLRRAYLKAHKAKRNPNGFDLMEFALRGDVTTKTIAQIQGDWQKRLDKVRDYVPAVHGLSEVRRYVDMLGGFWRVHSHRHVLQFDSLEAANPSTRHVSRSYPGCLHYFAIPLHRRMLLQRGTKFKSERLTQFENFDIAQFIQEGEGGPMLDAERLWTELLVEGELAGAKPLLVVVYALETIEKPHVEALCPLIADVLNRSFKNRAVFFCGPNATFRSLLPRYTRNTDYMRPTNMVVFVGDDGVSASQPVTVFCAEEYAAIEPIIAKLLASPDDFELLPSEFANVSMEVNARSVSAWPLIQALATENPTFLIFGDTGIERAVRKRYSLGEAMRVNRLLRGGRTFEEFAWHVRRQRCLAAVRDGQSGYWRFGTKMDSYLHLGRLFADSNLKYAIPESFTLQLRAQQQMHSFLSKNCEDFFLIGLLHPGIDVAQEIFQRPQFQKAELILLRRMAEIYWDVGPLMSCAGKSAVIVVDFIYSAQTIRRLLASLQYLEVNVIAVLSILTIRSPEIVGLNVLSFCECTKEEYDSFCRSEGKIDHG